MRMFKKVKIDAQDEPITSAQIGALYSNAEFIRNFWDATLWATSWPAAAPGDCDGKIYITPPLRIPVWARKLRYTVICARPAGAAAQSFTINAIAYEADPGFNYTIPSFTMGTTATVAAGICTLWDGAPDQPLQFKLVGHAAGSLLFFGITIDNDQISQQSLNWTGADLADLLCNKKDLAQNQFVAGWMAPNNPSKSIYGVEIAMGKAYVDFFNMAFLQNKASLSVPYYDYHTIQTDHLSTRPPVIGGSPRPCMVKATHREHPATTGIDEDIFYEDYDCHLKALDVLGKSWNTTAGTESGVLVQCMSDNADDATRNKVYIDAVRVGYQTKTAQDTGLDVDSLFPDNPSNDIVHSDYWNIKNVMAVAQAQHNAVNLRSGPNVSLLNCKGLDIALTTSYADYMYWFWNINPTDGHWIQPSAKQAINFTISMLVKPATGSRTITADVYCGTTNHTAVAVALDATTNLQVATFTGILTFPTYGATNLWNLFKMQLKINTNTTVKIWSVIAQLHNDVAY